ncbi:MAG: non-canonical purine NTP pyrophosphatase [Candidatus Omnitrophica bacterium]|nr:non-canonical purine NTP pyrophosphatase [Candidatus Omnitrophota bacterium]
MAPPPAFGPAGRSNRRFDPPSADKAGGGVAAARPTLVIATRNRHKVRELRRLLGRLPARFASLADFPQTPIVHENGRSFDDNAVRKARVAARATGCVALADDSGVEVDALGGRPGVRSARFAGSGATDAANNRKLLRLLRGVPSARRGACYRCSLAVATPSGRVWITRGAWRGRIATAPRGRGGFGYDPVFEIPRYRRSVAQLGAVVKQRLSHRAQAARKARAILRRAIRHRISR